MIHDYVKCHPHFALILNCCVWRCHVKVWCYCVSICYTIFLSSFFLLFLFLFHHSFEQLPCFSFFSPLSWKIWKNLAVPSVVNARKFHDESLFDDLFFWSICFIFSARSAPFVSQWFQCERNRIFWETIYHCFMFKPEWKSHEYTRIE